MVFTTKFVKQMLKAKHILYTRVCTWIRVHVYLNQIKVVHRTTDRDTGTR